MEQKTKGYWLFDRNGDTIKRGEGILSPKTGHILRMGFKDSLTFHRYTGYWAIYKWIEEN